MTLLTNPRADIPESARPSLRQQPCKLIDHYRPLGEQQPPGNAPEKDDYQS